MASNDWSTHPLFKAVQGDYILTRNDGVIRNDVQPKNISPDAIISNGSVIEGASTVIARGARIDASYIKDAQIGERASVTRSTLRAGHRHEHLCDPVGRYRIVADKTFVSAGAVIMDSSLDNASVDENSELVGSAVRDSVIGPDNAIIDAKIDLTRTGKNVIVRGPTELSEAWVGDGATFENRGYLEGVFLNEFPVLKWDADAKKIRVVETHQLPHLSRYGINSIHSSNSGRLFDRPGDGIVDIISPHEGLWKDSLLSHEPMYFGPLGWVTDWTKVVGQSAEPHADIEAQINDIYFSYTMEFSVCGYGGDLSRGQVMPGEKSIGIGYKRREAMWVFDRAPAAVIAMAGRLYERLSDDQKPLADRVVDIVLSNARCLLKLQASQIGMTLDGPADQMRGGQKKWLGRSWARVKAHSKPGVWAFKNGKPVNWFQTSDGLWTNPLLDTGDNPEIPGQLTESDLLTQSDIPRLNIPPVFSDSERAALNAATSGGFTSEDGGLVIASVIKGRSKIGSGAVVIQSVIDNAIIKPGSVIIRSIVRGSETKTGYVGSNCNIIHSCLTDSSLGSDSTARHSRVASSTLAEHTRLDAFARLDMVLTTRPTIFSGWTVDTSITTPLMSMHMAGACDGLVALPARCLDPNGEELAIEAIPMIGGGTFIRGNSSSEQPVLIECSFIGSNCVIEGNTFIGLGSFILDGIRSGEGLLPFTLKLGPGSENDDIGGVLSAMGHVILTHFVNWTFQALPANQRDTIRHLIEGGARMGMAAIKQEIGRRSRGVPFDPNGVWSRFASLPNYQDTQLQHGLECYNEALDGRWRMKILPDGALAFDNPPGMRWVVKGGTVRYLNS